jgi:hypothetical protein
MCHLIKYSRSDDRDLSNPSANVITLYGQLFFFYLEMEADRSLESQRVLRN